MTTRRGALGLLVVAALAASPVAGAQMDAPASIPDADSAAVPPSPAPATPNLDPAEVAEFYALAGPPPSSRRVPRPDLSREVRLRRGRGLRALGVAGLVIGAEVAFLGMFVVPQRTDSAAAFVTSIIVAPVLIGTGSIGAFSRGSHLVRASRPPRVEPNPVRRRESISERLVPIVEGPAAPPPTPAVAASEERPQPGWGRFRSAPNSSVDERLASLPRRRATRAFMALAPAFVALMGAGLIAGMVDSCGGPMTSDPSWWSCDERRRYLVRTGVVTFTALTFEGLALRRWSIRRAGIRALEREGFRVERARRAR